MNNKLPFGLAMLAIAFMTFGGIAFADIDASSDEASFEITFTSTNNKGVLQGYVYDNRGEPLEGATVTLDQEGLEPVKTDSKGEFMILDVDMDVKSTLYVSHSGFKTYHEIIKPDVGLKIYLERADTVSYIVWTLVIMVAVLLVVAFSLIYKARKISKQE